MRMRAIGLISVLIPIAKLKKMLFKNEDFSGLQMNIYTANKIVNVNKSSGDKFKLDA